MHRDYASLCSQQQAITKQYGQKGKGDNNFCRLSLRLPQNFVPDSQKNAAHHILTDIFSGWRHIYTNNFSRNPQQRVTSKSTGQRQTKRQVSSLTCLFV